MANKARLKLLHHYIKEKIESNKGLGVTWRVGVGAWRRGVDSFAVDLAAIKLVCEVRTKDLGNIIEELLKAVAENSKKCSKFSSGSTRFTLI